MTTSINYNGTTIRGEKIMANVWGGQVEVVLSTWSEIKKLGFKKRDRAFGTLNNGEKALYFGMWNNEKREHDWFLTTEKLEDIED